MEKSLNGLSSINGTDHISGMNPTLTFELVT